MTKPTEHKITYNLHTSNGKFFIKYSGDKEHTEISETAYELKLEEKEKLKEAAKEKLLNSKTTGIRKYVIYESSGKYFVKYAGSEEKEISKTEFMDKQEEKNKEHERLNKKH